MPMTRWTASSRPDQDGRFKFANLPPGAYYAIAVEYVAQGEWSDPEWLARASKKATRFMLDEGTTRMLELKLADPKTTRPAEATMSCPAQWPFLPARGSDRTKSCRPSGPAAWGKSTARVIRT